MKTSIRFRFYQKVALLMAGLMAFQAAFPLGAWALTSGPSQPEFSEFEPVGTTQMVDLFTGDFTYNIPLFELPGPDGGYPFNLSYHSGITMDQEATWVGLGWTMNHGAITRSMRGLPDDFAGDEVWRKMDMLPNRTWNFNVGGDVEAFGYKRKLRKGETPNPDSSSPDNNGSLPGSPGKLELSLGLNVMHNNYKGWGLGFNAGLQTNLGQGQGSAFDGGVNLGANTFDGASLQPNLSFGILKEGLLGVQTSANISGRDGMESITLGATSRLKVYKPKGGESNTNGQQILGGGSAVLGSNYNFSFARPAYSPQVTMPYRGMNFSGSFKGGFNANFGLGVGARIGASFSRQRLANANVWRKESAYGYFNMKDRSGFDSSLMDFNREKDGVIRESTPNLGTPITTPDIYAVTGQGIGGSYRAYRSDIGILTDPFEISASGGGVLGVEIDPGITFDLGADLGGNMGLDVSGQWNINASTNLKKLRHTATSSQADYEPFYFKAGGEMTAEPSDAYNYTGGDQAVRVKLGNNKNLLGRMTYDPSGIFETANKEERGISTGTRTERKPRANSILPITNEQLIGEGMSTEALKEYRIEYLDMVSGTQTTLSRPAADAQKKKHVAGITATQANGARYVYALPVKNHWQEEMVFSIAGGEEDYCNPIYTGYSVDANGNINHKVDGTEEFLNHTRIPEYTHAYLLTSVLGADYVDLDSIAGPSDGDYGYWVKFNYVKTSDRYKWRAPYFGANYQKGKMHDKSDDKASIMYGEREQYYLASAETRTHIADFEIAERRDGRGAYSRTQRNATSGEFDFNATEASYRLNKISLYSKLERFNADGSVNSTAVPIKSVHFKYDYSLCANTRNNDGGAEIDNDQTPPRNVNLPSGKLGLKKLWFEYRNNTRGKLSPYQFDYTGLNPLYSDLQFDRWGTYRNTTNNCDMLLDPYTSQVVTPISSAAAWHLDEITLPSGAIMNIDYESDQYAYVQDREAMRMFKIEGMGFFGNVDINTNSTVGERGNNQSELVTDDLRVYFELENLSDSVEQYTEALHGVRRDENGNIDYSNAQIYFKTLLNMDGNGSWEYVSGYAEIEDAYISGSKGVIELKPVNIGAKGNKRDFHPIVAAAWQWLKMEYPSALYSEKSLANFTEKNFGDLLGEFASAFGSVKSIFKNYYRNCSAKQLAKEIDLDKSFIRLVDPDHNKYGGGSRVAQITIDDRWDVGEDGSNDEVTYGQVFDYTTINEDGEVISSGVASNEPAIGGDENALRYAKKWSDQKLFQSDQNMFYEYPNNESYYPGAGVGYSKVTVKSLATHLSQTGSSASLPTGFATTGETVNEFYTAKDFPTLVEETFLDKRIGHFKWLPLPGGSATFENYTGSQGYAITLNDMHGKPHKVTHYGLDNLGARLEQKLSEVIYTYAADSVEVYTVAGVKKKAQVLTNEVDVLLSDDPTAPYAQIEKQQLGVDVEFFTDMREMTTYSESNNIGLNLEFTGPILFAFNVIPRMSRNEGRTRTVVTNKVIRKSGILTQIDAYDGQSHIRTNNRVFDPMTGEALLTTVNNSFDDLVYNYNIPARYAYDRMGEAYKNIGMSFMGMLQVNATCGLFEMTEIPPEKAALLVPGDECVVTSVLGENPCSTSEFTDLCDHRLFTYVGNIGGAYLFENNDLETEVPPVTVDVLITRSGRRNHLSAKAASITALNNPMINRDSVSAGLIVNVPDDTASYTSEVGANIDFRTIDSVLSASAIVYSDEWDLERSSCKADSMIITGEPAQCYCAYVGYYDTSSLCLVTANIDLAGTGSDVIVSFEPIATNGECFPTGNSGVITPLPSNMPANVTGCVKLGCFTGPIDNVTLSFNSSDPLCMNLNSNSFFRVLTQESCGTPGDPITIVRSERSFHLGQKGIWRPLRDYTYVDNRNISHRTTGLANTRKDGTFNNLSLFNWKNPFYLQSSAGENWKHSSETTKYASNGEQVESRDVLGLYSSALYGYNENLPTAVAANASYYEMAFESFEEHEVGSLAAIEETGNFDLECELTSKTAVETYNILGGYIDGNYIWIDKPYYSGIPLPNRLTLALQDEMGREVTQEANINAITGLPPAEAGLDIPYRDSICVLAFSKLDNCDNLGNTPKTGRAIFSYCYDVPASTSCNATLSNTSAHTGEQSLEVTSTSTFEQKTLRLEHERKYVLSGWVHRPGVEHFTFDDGTIALQLDMGSGASGRTAVFKPSGEIIEGWQRIEGVFEYVAGGEDKLTFKNTGSTVYFDDLRIYPLDGGMQTYVYDPIDYRLRAVLDNNNYATLYYYDDEGNLFLQKKETARGIKTIQETKQYIIDRTD